jgi:outer membrane protein insertion porin family
VWSLTTPELTHIVAACIPVAANTTGKPFTILPGGTVTSCGPTTGPTGFTRVPGVREEFVGNSPSPRLSIGVGVNWVSPFGPFRIDIAKALLKQEGDDTELFSFNVGTQF